jgi:signal transduction histidine kinase
MQLVSVSVSEVREACLALKQEVTALKETVKAQRDMIETLEKKIGTAVKSPAKSSAKDN